MYAPSRKTLGDLRFHPGRRGRSEMVEGVALYRQHGIFGCLGPRGPEAAAAYRPVGPIGGTSDRGDSVVASCDSPASMGGRREGRCGAEQPNREQRRYGAPGAMAFDLRGEGAGSTGFLVHHASGT